ncbi:peptidase T [Granulimonas faecalis]|uniref:Peptidase T n=1 Tax=Granulimonas faecalis TaxID=2894155 RepID=A0AAV5B0D0_9ACTN|nr:peptidase T [Granulimonas faecalis]GJM55116.1 peptidase T [Granulimonas faecalis]
MGDIAERLVRYCAIASPSSPDGAGAVPSTPSQHAMAALLGRELEELGAEDVSVDAHAYVTAHWPASPGCEGLPRLGLCAHLDTAWQAVGDPVRPRVVRYGGGPLVMGEVDGETVAVTPEEEPVLLGLAGTDVVVTDGTSLLGGDDKAGIAEIMAYLERLAADPAIPHPPLAVAFVPDEEVGHGASLLDIDAWGAAWAFTLDTGPLGEVTLETFNACDAFVEARGRAVHTGWAKGVLVNACEALAAFHGLLPAAERPEHTEGREGFYHLVSMEGECERARAHYIVRDHDRAGFERRRDVMAAACDHVNRAMGAGTLSVSFRDTYRNMGEEVGRHPELLEAAFGAFRDVGVEPSAVPMRGGTDGAQLTFRGLPCPNLSAGYHLAHSRREFVPVREMEVMVDVLEHLGRRLGSPPGG